MEKASKGKEGRGGRAKTEPEPGGDSKRHNVYVYLRRIRAK